MHFPIQNIRRIIRRPRLLTSSGLGLVVFLLLWPSMGGGRAMLVGFDIGATVFLALMAAYITGAMRDELQRVLGYPQIVPRLDFYQLAAAQVLAGFDQWVRVVEVAPKAPFVCKDADDQRFIDLAVAHQALLLSKDQMVLRLGKRLLAAGVRVQRAIG